MGKMMLARLGPSGWEVSALWFVGGAEAGLVGPAGLAGLLPMPDMFVLNSCREGIG